MADRRRRRAIWYVLGLAALSIGALSWFESTDGQRFLMARELERLTSGAWSGATLGAITHLGLISGRPALVQKAQVTARRIQDNAARALALCAIAAVFNQLGDKTQVAVLLAEAEASANSVAPTAADPQTFHFYLSVGECVSRAGDKDKALAWFRKALQLADGVSDTKDRAFALAGVLSSLAGAGERGETAIVLKKAQEVAHIPVHQPWEHLDPQRAQQESIDRKASSLGAISDALVRGAESGRDLSLFGEAEKIAESMPPSFLRSEAFRKISEALVGTAAAIGDVNLLTRAELNSEKISKDLERIHVLCKIAGAMWAAGRTDQALRLVAKADSIARHLPDDQPTALSWIAEELMVAGQFERSNALFAQALELARDDSYYLWRISESLAHSGSRSDDSTLIDKAQSVALKIQDPTNEARANIALAGALAKAGERAEDAGLLMRALSTANSIASQSERNQVLSVILRAMVHTAVRLKDRALLDQARSVASAVAAHYSTSDSVLDDLNRGAPATAAFLIATAQAQIGELRAARQTALAQDSDDAAARTVAYVLAIATGTALERL
jgi:tetratricopeptide (TPR) repeat protein